MYTLLEHKKSGVWEIYATSQLLGSIMSVIQDFSVENYVILDDKGQIIKLSLL